MVDRTRRLDWVFERSPIYFITATTHGRQEILANQPIFDRLIQFAEAGPALGAWLGAFVLMPDHLHAFVALDHDRMGSSSQLKKALSRWVKSLKNTLSGALRQSGVKAPHWQRGCFDHVLRSHESYCEKWKYVRENPVAAGLVAKAEDWPYFAEPFFLEFRDDPN